MRAPELLRRVTARLARGMPIDWDAVERSASDEKVRGLIRQLRVVSEMEALHRSLREPASEVGATAGSSSTLLAPGSRWGSLEVLERIGRGAFGEVYRARDPRLDREVALKLMRRSSGTADEETIAEARLLARARHPNVVLVYGAERIAGRVGIWMELLEGQTLDQLLAARGVLGEREAALIGVDLCRALAALHAAGIAHRDLKLANVMRAVGGRIVLVDFGLGGESARAGEGDDSGGLRGTPLFMAPEVLAGARADARSDLYSLGVVLFALVSGTLPLEASSLTELRDRHRRGDLRQLRDLRPAIAGPFAEIVGRLLSADRERRFQTAGRAEHALLALLSSAELSTTLADDPSSRPTPPYRLAKERDLFVGREETLATLESSFDAGARLVTLLGPGGVGKTRLATRFGWKSLSDWPGGVWFADLTEARSEQGVVLAVAAALRVPLGAGDATHLIGHAMAARGRCLVILDNFEQVVDCAPATVGNWLGSCPELRLLATTRVRLKLNEERVLPVEPLSLDDSLSLLTDRARSWRSGINSSAADQSALRELAEIAEGMPLAIELVAARTRVLTPVQLVARQRSRLRLLGGPGTGRHDSLRAAIGGSWDLLQPWEQAALAQCSVFDGGFSIEAAEGIVDLGGWPDAPWIVDVLQSLVDQCLLRSWTIETPLSESEPSIRFGMFVSIQEYASEELARDPGQRREVEERHGRWFGALGADDALAALDRHGGLELRRALLPELENLCTACARAIVRADRAAAVSTYRAAAAILDSRGPHARAIELGASLLALDLPPELAARVQLTIGLAQQRVGQRDGATRALEQATELFRRSGDRAREGLALSRLATLPMNVGRFDEAEPLLERALAIHREVGDRAAEGNTLGNLALLHHERGALDQAIQCFEAALAIHQSEGNVRSEGVVRGNLGNLRSDLGQYDQAAIDFESALTLHRRVGNRRFEAVVLSNLGTMCVRRGDRATARRHYSAALTIQRELGARDFESRGLVNLGDLALDEGHADEASGFYQAALAIVRETGNPRAKGVVLGHLARAELLAGRLDLARDAQAEGEAIFSAEKHPTLLAGLIATRAELALKAGDREAALAALREAEAAAAAGEQSDLVLNETLAELRARIVTPRE